MAKGKYKRTPEIREKMKNAQTGKTYGQETKDKLSKLTSGKNNPRYIEDRSKLKKLEDRRSTATLNWSKEVKNRDNWKCRLSSDECSGRLEAHHIFNWRDYPELRYLINNGITLCKYHHPLKWEEERRMIPIFQELIEKYSIPVASEDITNKQEK